MMVITPERRKEFEELGEAQVWLKFRNRASGDAFQFDAVEWLAERQEAKRKVDEERSKSILWAAWIAAGAALAAVVIGIGAWLFPLH
jgi:hypothetical protein